MAKKDQRIGQDQAIRQLGDILGRKITRLERHVRELEVASQGAFRSVEDGAIDVYDDDGVLRERIGKQLDGSFGRITFTGEVPPAPSEPDVQVIGNGIVAVTWDGRFEEKYTGQFRNVRIHLGDTADFVCDRNNQEGAIFARRGGTVVVVTESDDDNPVWVRLVATNRAGQASPASDAVLVDELDEDNLEEDEELEWENGDGHTLTAGDIAAGTVTFPLSYIPEEESLLAWWHPDGLAFAGVPQGPSEFTVDYEAQTVTWPLTAGREKAGDRLRVYYAHVDGGVKRVVTIQMIANDHNDTLALTFILPDGTRYAVPGVNTPGSGPVVEFGDFVIEEMTMEFKNTTKGVTVTYPSPAYIRRTPISGTDGRGAYEGYRYEFEDRGPTGDADFNDIIMDVKGYDEL